MFVIKPGGKLEPSTVSAPANVTVELSVSSGDGRAHRVVLGTMPARSLAIPARGASSLRLAGLKPGRYEIEVDGSHAGALIAGAQPGP